MNIHLSLYCVRDKKFHRIYLRPATKLGQGYIFRSVCQQFCPQGGACVVLFGGGACVVLFGGCAWFYLGGMHGFIWGGMHGFIQGGASVVFSVFSDTMRYGQWAGGTHPTGMHSCTLYVYFISAQSMLFRSWRKAQTRTSWTSVPRSTWKPGGSKITLVRKF